MSRSTTISVNPREPPSGSVRTTAITRSEWMPLVMNVFAPSTTQPPSTRTPDVRMPRRSLPVPGSVIAIAPISSPAAILGSHRCFCSSLPRLAM